MATYPPNGPGDTPKPAQTGPAAIAALSRIQLNVPSLVGATGPGLAPRVPQASTLTSTSTSHVPLPQFAKMAADTVVGLRSRAYSQAQQPFVQPAMLFLLAQENHDFCVADLVNSFEEDVKCWMREARAALTSQGRLPFPSMNRLLKTSAEPYIPLIYLTIVSRCGDEYGGNRILINLANQQDRASQQAVRRPPLFPSHLSSPGDSASERPPPPPPLPPDTIEDLDDAQQS
ncbi:hypothetical protein JCM11641_008395 [Rhodosporidiobolus odoratus]